MNWILLQTYEFSSLGRMAAARGSFFRHVSLSRQNPSCARQGFSTGLARSIAARHDNILKELDENLEYGSTGLLYTIW